MSESLIRTPGNGFRVFCDATVFPAGHWPATGLAPCSRDCSAANPAKGPWSPQSRPEVTAGDTDITFAPVPRNAAGRRALRRPYLLAKLKTSWFSRYGPLAQ